MTTATITCSTTTGTLSHWLNTSVLSDSSLSSLLSSHMPSTRRRMAWLSWLLPSSRLTISRQGRRVAIDFPFQLNIKALSASDATANSNWIQNEPPLAKQDNF
jgi:hypothetical protein